MQAQGYIQSVGDEVESFWKESNGLAEENDMDQNLAYMFTMIQKAHGKVITYCNNWFTFLCFSNNKEDIQDADFEEVK